MGHRALCGVAIGSNEAHSTHRLSGAQDEWPYLLVTRNHAKFIPLCLVWGFKTFYPY